jgi:hypothetical protein
MLSSSVARRMPLQSDIYSAVRMWQIRIKCELSKVPSSILKSVLFIIVLHYFNMNIPKTKLKGLSEIRFGSTIFLLRMAGIPLKMKKLKPLYTIYMVTVIVCSCSAFVGVCMDAYMHRDDLGRSMMTMRVLISFTNIMWIFSYCR